LRGSTNQRVLELRHDGLSTYGIGADRSAEHWRSLLRQLVHLGYLRQDMGEYPVLQLTAAAGPLLRGEASLMLAAPRVKVAAEEAGAAKGKGARRRRGAAGRLVDVPAAGLGGAADDGAGMADGEALFEQLRALRRSIADREGVPAYVIFHDATLREMAAQRPFTTAELLLVGGVGERKLEKYGEEFLQALRGFDA
jgi:ATP-dependent DNA helicase RecQ